MSNRRSERADEQACKHALLSAAEPPGTAAQNSELLNEQIGRLLSGRLRWLLSKRFVIWLL